MQITFDTDSAFKVGEEGLVLIDSLLAKYPDVARYKFIKSVTLMKLNFGEIQASFLPMLINYRDFETSPSVDYDNGLTLLKSLVAEHPKLKKYKFELALSLYKRGVISTLMEGYDPEKSYFKESKNYLSELSNEFPDNPDYHAYDLYFGFYSQVYNQNGIENIVDNLVSEFENLTKKYPEIPFYENILSAIYSQYYRTTMLSSEKSLANEKMVKILDRLKSNSQNMPGYVYSKIFSILGYQDSYEIVFSTQNNIQFYKNMQYYNNFDLMIDKYNEALSELEILSNDNQDNKIHRLYLSRLYNKIGFYYFSKQDSHKAIESYKTALEILENLNDKYPNSYQIVFALCRNYHDLANVSIDRGFSGLAKATRLLEKSVGLLEHDILAKSERISTKRILADQYELLARINITNHQFIEAIQSAKKAISFLPDSLSANGLLVIAYSLNNKYNLAEDILNKYNKYPKDIHNVFNSELLNRIAIFKNFHIYNTDIEKIEKLLNAQHNIQDKFWHYCKKPKGYYPYISNCPGGWELVEPVTEKK
ncbi:hypothetical protein KEF85_10000 [Methylomonas paludis]|uniref:Tetratricopeptide repeat protein n=1 Tax=Methylomonas paludis TaxID=1173101 RepID=A0A975R8Y5_9GAMM|nr:hypothetical protein [Methylomonas paludis]QWF69708.1 hypothetical protein KEF85_10000 [Methylomonas paludis]